MENKNVFAQLGVSDAVYALGEEVLCGLRDRFAELDRTAEYNQAKVIAAISRRLRRACCSRSES